MPTPVTKMQAEQAASLVKQAFPEVFAIVSGAGFTWNVEVRPKSAPGSIVFGPHELDEGHGGIALEATKRIRALLDGTEYQAPVYQTFGEFITGGANVYGDVMTHGSGELHASRGEVVDGGVTEEETDANLLAEVGTLAAERLGELLHSDDDATRFAAAMAIVERSEGDESEGTDDVAVASEESEAPQEAGDDEEAIAESGVAEAEAPKRTRKKAVDAVTEA